MGSVCYQHRIDGYHPTLGKWEECGTPTRMLGIRLGNPPAPLCPSSLHPHHAQACHFQPETENASSRNLLFFSTRFALRVPSA